MQNGYNIFQINLKNPNYEYEWTANPIAWTFFAHDAEHLCDHLNEYANLLYFFITKKG